MTSSNHFPTRNAIFIVSFLLCAAKKYVLVLYVMNLDFSVNLVLFIEHFEFYRNCETSEVIAGGWLAVA